MKIYCIFMIFACVLPKCSAYHISDSEAGRTTASTLVKEGLPAEIFCMVEGTGDYFWRKGESFDKSTLVASFTGDKANKDNEPYVVTVNGTLLIRNVTLKDEGKYFCRVTSVENECHGEVKVFVQASLRNFVLAIEPCDIESSCLSYISPSQSISLTCTAYNAPPLMTLKWFNGSKEITEGIQQNVILPQNGNPRYITSTVAAVYGHPAFLTCQAVDPKRSNDDVRFAHAQVKMTVPFIETLPIWLFVAVTSAGCFIVVGIILLIKAKANRKRRKNNKTSEEEQVELLKGDVHTKVRAIADMEGDVQIKVKAIADLEGDVQIKVKAIADMEGDLQIKVKAIADMEGDLQIKAKAIADMEGDVQIKAKAIADMEGDVQIKAKAIADMEGDLQIKVKAIADLERDVQIKAKSIADLKKTVEQKDKEMNEQRQKIPESQTNMMQREKEIKNEKDEHYRIQSDVSSYRQQGKKGKRN